MVKLLLFLFLYSCSQVSKRPTIPDDRISVQTALDHIRSSYLKGCVDAWKDLGFPVSFEICRDQAILHEKEVRGILGQDPLL